MDINYEFLSEYEQRVGGSFYLLNLDVFRDNYRNLLNEFQKIYHNTYIAYSFKTNYIPNLCAEILSMGGCAEVVSGMELWLARKVGFNDMDIFFNGPCKNLKDIEELLVHGGHLNIDSYSEIDKVVDVANSYPDMHFSVGVRCALDIGQEQPSRFGFDEESIYKAICVLNELQNVKVVGLHTHLPYRAIETFERRGQCLSNLIHDLAYKGWEYISIGGGYMSPMPQSLCEEVSNSKKMPSYSDYAKTIVPMLKYTFEQEHIDPKIILEPGSAIVANAMSLVTRVDNIKQNRGKTYVTVNGSTFNMNPTVKGLNRPIRIVRGPNRAVDVDEADIVGFTCIEGDCLYHGLKAALAEDDYILFDNVGSYSITMNPSFIRTIPGVVIVDANTVAVAKKVSGYDNSFREYEF